MATATMSDVSPQEASFNSRAINPVDPIIDLTIPEHPLRKFKLMRGTHEDWLYENGRAVLHKQFGRVVRKSILYRAPAIIITEADLSTQNSVGSTKFEPLRDDGTPYGSSPAIPTGAHIWDPATESIDGFRARILAQQNAKVETPPTSPSAPVRVQTPPQAPVQPVIAPENALPGANAGGTFDAMNEQQLRKFAADEEIDIRKCKSRDDILRFLKSVKF